MEQIGNVYNFQHEKKGNIYQGESVKLKRGIYKIECWGAQGGTGCMNGQLKYHGGKGAYTSGFILINHSTTLYVYVGTQGLNGVCTKNGKTRGGVKGGGDSGV